MPKKAYQLAIKRPGGKRRTFAIQKCTGENGGSRETLKSLEIDEVNREFLAGRLTERQAERRIQGYLEQLYAERDRDRPQVPEENLRLLERYWKAEYSDRDITKPEKRKRDLTWALENLGDISLAVGTRQQMAAALEPLDARKHRRTVERLNQLLKWAGRPFVLRKKRAPPRTVKYLTLPEFEQVLPHLGELSLMAKAAFITGCRPGELFPLTELTGPCVWVATQLHEDLTPGPTKTRKMRKAFVLKERRKWIQEWLQIPAKEREKMRNWNHAKVMRTACRRAFPGRPEKWCVFYDLRHSYAIHLLGKGANIQAVANSLGNSVSVCEDYYAGHVLTDPGIEYLENLSGKK